MEELRTSQPAAGEISWVGRCQDGADIDLLDYIKAGFPNTLINLAPIFGTEEIYRNGDAGIMSDII